VAVLEIVQLVQQVFDAVRDCLKFVSPKCEFEDMGMTLRAFRFLSAKHALQALRRQEIKVSHFDDLNDPFELYGVNLADRRHRRTFHEFKRWASGRFGLLCFCRRWRNPLLWSHYGDRHKGVALEFELDDDLVSEVRYSPYRLRLDIEKALARGSFTEQEAYEMAITKSAHWRYEEEVRVFCELPQCIKRDGLLFEPVGEKLQIVGLVLGPLCALSADDVENALPKGRHIRMICSRLAFTSFNVIPNRAKRQFVYGKG
jgi:hypothetical protein